MQKPLTSEHIMRYISDEFLDGSQTDFDLHSPLLEWGIVDSVGMVRLLAFIDRQFGVRIPQSDITPANFRDVHRISTIVDTYVARHPTAQPRDEDPELRELIAFGAEERRFDISPHALIYALEVPGAEPTCWLLPEPGRAATSYADVQRAFEGQHRSLACELAGFGLSTFGGAAPTFEEQMRLLAAAMRQDERPRYVLIGHGLSAGLALELARRSPGRTRAVVALGFGAGDSLRAAARQTADAFHTSHARSPNSLEAAGRADTERRLASDGYRALSEWALDERVDAMLREVAVPVLFIGGLDDRIVAPADVEAAAALVRGASVKWLARAGHDFPRERADETVSLIHTYLHGLEHLEERR